MTKCLECKKFDKEHEVCGLEPSEIEEVVCLLRWLIGLQLESMDERDEGDDWKFGDK
jgi:hypothetical protein